MKVGLKSSAFLRSGRLKFVTHFVTHFVPHNDLPDREKPGRFDGMKTVNLLLRNRIYWLKRRVPKRFADVEPREFVRVSLGTYSPAEATAKAAQIWNEMISAWQARQDGLSEDAERRFTAAKRIAQRHGLAYLPQDQVLALPTDDLLARIEAIPEVAGLPDKVEAAALLGKVPEPKISVSRALELYFEIARDKRLGKSDAQIRKWEAPIRQANRDFVEVVGDKALEDLTRDDVRAFRDWWIEKIEADDLSPSTANKNMDHFGKVLKLVNEEKRLGLTLPLGGLRLDEGEKGKRPAFSEKWIRDRILVAGALDGLEAQARAIMLVMVNTGARPSELCALTSETIALAANVPHISIEPDGRKLKTRHAKRKIPLTGVSLEAMRGFPGGFPTYRGTEKLSKIVSDFLSAAELRETPAHSLYSLRHSFEDRLLHAGVDERIRRDLMGHRLTRERYGEGASLEHMHGLLAPIAL